MTIKDTLDSEINSVLASNQAGGMTAADLRQVLDDIVTALPVPAGASGDIQINDGAGGLASISRSGGVSTDYLAYDNTYKTIPAGGGSGTPGGSNGQLQYNNAGALGGLTIGGDATLNAGTGALTVTKTSGTAFSALATAAAVALGSQVSGVLPVANGGTGTTAPSLVAGSNVSISGAWPNQMITAAGGGGGTVVGDSTATFNTRAAAISATIASVATGGPSYIRTIGYAFVDDGGGSLYVRIGSTPPYSNLIWFSSADGQKWALVNKNAPLRLEQAGGGVTATGAANNAAVEAINSIFTTNKFGLGYGFAGANFELGYGSYNFASPWFVKGGCKITGQGSGFYGGYSTELKFPANSDGLVLGAAGNTNGRLYNTSGIYSDFDARASVIRDLKITGGWTGATTYAQNHTTGQRGIGILSKTDSTFENLYISGFAEFGVYIKGTAGGGGSATEPAYNTSDNLDLDESYVCAQGYANSFACYRVVCEDNGLDGFRVKGADANAGSFISCSATTNVGWGFNDQCFLGNWYWGNHAASNGTGDGIDWKSGKQFGAYQCYGDSQFTTFIANYSEGDFAGRNSFLNGFHLMIGGLMAGGFHGSVTSISNGGTGGIHLSPFTTPTLGGNISFGDSNVDGEIVNFNSGDLFWRNQFNRLELGSFSKPNSFVMTMGGYSAAQGRAASIGSGEVVLSRGYWLGSPAGNEGFDMRFRGVYDGLPTSGQFGRGDHIDMLNPSAGGAYSYVCVTAGDYAGTPPVWKSKGNLAA